MARLVAAALLVASCEAWAPVHAPGAPSHAARWRAPRASVCALAPPLDYVGAIAPSFATPLENLSSESLSSSALEHMTTLLGEGVFDLLQDFAGSPAILLVPIGAGLLVASVIIFILVKAAG
ncbi:hypothetical protein AB1Y20_018593 [Prymnesium parvum]|uniref:Uncharacterized protein n=1 Tax=Prymnesium parvum TaxID=97485 RepID=A0AB34JS97_PRYPA